MPNPIKQFIKESEKKFDMEFPEMFDGFGNGSFQPEVKRFNSSQQLALVEKIKEMVEGKRRKICGEKYNSTQEDINYGYDEALDDILQDLTIKN